MAVGFSEIILILLSLGGFGVSQNPAAPPTAEVMRYAPEDAEVMAYLDGEAVVAKNWETLKLLAREPMVQSSPEAVRIVSHILSEAEKTRAMIKSGAGFDPITDVRSAAVFVSFRGSEEPAFLVVGRGKFATDTVDRLVKKMGGTRSVVSDRPMLSAPDGRYALTIAADGTFLGGTKTLVEQRLGSWQPKKGPLYDKAAELLDDKPFFAVVARMAPATAKQHGEATKEPLLRDMILGIDNMGVALYWNAVALNVTARTAAGYARAALVAEGIVPLTRASSLGARGLARVLLAALESYTSDPMIAAIVAHRADAIRFVDRMTGDGSFAVAFDKKDAERRISLRMTGKSLSEVLPAMVAFVPAFAAALLWRM